MSDEVAAKMPPVILQTCEFDMYRKCAEEYGEKLKKHGKFIGIGIIPGQQHNFPFPGSPRFSLWPKTVRRIFKEYLH